MRFEIRDGFDKKIFGQAGVGIKNQNAVSGRFLQTLVPSAGQTDIGGVLNKFNVLWVAGGGRSVVDNYDFQIGIFGSSN